MKYRLKLISLIIGIIMVLLLNNALQNTVKNINPMEMSQEYNKPEYYLIDVREKFDYENIHIKNSKNIPLERILKEDNKIPKDKNIILICRSGKTSLVAYKILKEKGYKKIYNLKGGILDWQRQGLEVIKENGV